MTYRRLIMTAGFAMFSMFFGSGNLVFPLLIGVASSTNYPFACAGLIITGVMVPFLGLLALIYYQGNRHAFFRKLGSPLSFVITFTMLAMMGPLGVIPRCVMVTYGGINLMFPSLKASIFNALFLGLTGFFVWKKSTLITVVGKILTPFLLGGISVLIIRGLIIESPYGPSDTIEVFNALKIGFSQGYQTMDLLAAFFFSAAIVKYIATQVKSYDNTRMLEYISISASLVGAVLLSIVYIGFVFLGAKYATILQNVSQEKLLIAIAQQCLGSFALPITGSIILLACLTTAIILTSLFTDFLTGDLFQNKMPRWVSLTITLSVAYIFSLMGFKALGLWISAILFVTYPALIAYTIFAIIDKKLTGPELKISYAKKAFYVTFILTLSLRFSQYLGVF